MSKINSLQAAALNETTKPVENKASAAKSTPVKTSQAKSTSTPKSTKSVTAKPVAKTTAIKSVTAKPAAAKSAVVKPALKIPAASKSVAKKAEKPAKEVKEKTTKLKMERDSFTMPKTEYAQLYVLKERMIKLGQPSKKSELLRAGIMQLTAMTDAALKATLAKVPAIKTGRPKKK